jgi:hypothetical protein
MGRSHPHVFERDADRQMICARTGNSRYDHLMRDLWNRP